MLIATYVGEVRRVFLDEEGAPRADVLVKAKYNKGELDVPIEDYSIAALPFSQFSLERKGDDI